MTRLGRLVCALAAVALTTTACATAFAEGRHAADGSTPTQSFPGVDPRGLDGSWTTGTISRVDLLNHAVQQGASRSCAVDFLAAAGVTKTLGWQLYFRDGQWLLFGVVDGADPVGFDGGTYTRFLSGEWVEFTAQDPTFKDDYWLVPTLQGKHLSMDFNSITHWRPEPDSPCFVKAATIIELTNPFTRIS